MRKCVSGIIAAALWASIVQAESHNSADGSQTFQLASADITVSLRPVVRPSAKEYRVSTEGNARFQAWLGAFRERAEQQGISAATLDRALAGLTYDKKII